MSGRKGWARAAIVMSEIAALAERWAYQATDYDEDTEQQIADGNELLRLLRSHGVDAPEPKPPPKPIDPKWVEHLSHPSKWNGHRWQRAEPTPGCEFCNQEAVNG